MDLENLKKYIELLEKQRDREIHELKKAQEKELDLLKSANVELKHNIEQTNSFITQRVEQKFDSFDTALRGNGKIGVYEQMRNIRMQVRVLAGCVLLLAGFKVWGLGLQEWFNEADIFKTETKIEEIHNEDNTSTVIDNSSNEIKESDTLMTMEKSSLETEGKNANYFEDINKEDTREKKNE